MKISVFLSWSGEASGKVATALWDWLPSVQQSIDPFMSSINIEKGARWSAEIAQSLQICGFGVLCLTPDNLGSPWLLFEAGALSKMVNASSVVPLVTCGLEKNDIKSPLSQFQAAYPVRDEMFAIVSAINEKLGTEKLAEGRLKQAFDLAWPVLEAKLKEIEAEIAAGSTKRSVKPAPDIATVADKLDELIDLTRANNRILQNPEQLLPADYLQFITNPPIVLGAGSPAGIGGFGGLAAQFRRLKTQPPTAPTISSGETEKPLDPPPVGGPSDVPT